MNQRFLSDGSDGVVFLLCPYYQTTKDDNYIRLAVKKVDILRMNNIQYYMSYIIYELGYTKFVESYALSLCKYS